MELQAKHFLFCFLTLVVMQTAMNVTKATCAFPFKCLKPRKYEIRTKQIRSQFLTTDKSFNAGLISLEILRSYVTEHRIINVDDV